MMDDNIVDLTDRFARKATTEDGLTKEEALLDDILQVLCKHSGRDFDTILERADMVVSRMVADGWLDE